LMAPAGATAESVRTSAMERYPNGYIAVIEGGVPSGASGAYCLIGGRPAADVVREVSAGALATVAVGSCASDGGAAAASGGQTGAGGVRSLVPNGKLITLPGCPMNIENVVAVWVNYIASGQLPAVDGMGRPLFAYGDLIHNKCERRPHFEFGEFATEWGDEGAQKGWCLYRMGCKGPETNANCPTVKFSEGLSWPVKAGTGCFGCTMPGFWDAMSPFYRRLQSPIPFGLAPNINADQVGVVLVGGIAAVTMVHGGATFVREQRNNALRRRRTRRAARAGRAEVTASEAAAGAAEVAGSVAELAGAPAEVGAVPVALAAGGALAPSAAVEPSVPTQPPMPPEPGATPHAAEAEAATAAIAVAGRPVVAEPEEPAVTEPDVPRAAEAPPVAEAPVAPPDPEVR
jgi:hydrogenase small subunit